jgi:predicted secreted protein
VKCFLEETEYAIRSDMPPPAGFPFAADRLCIVGSSKMTIKVLTFLLVYMLFWVLSAFLVMPFGLRAHSDEGEEEHRRNLPPGAADSSPVNFRPGLIVLRATLLSGVVVALFYLNAYMGWVSLDDVSLVHPPANLVKNQY